MWPPPSACVSVLHQRRSHGRRERPDRRSGSSAAPPRLVPRVGVFRRFRALLGDVRLFQRRPVQRSTGEAEEPEEEQLTTVRCPETALVSLQGSSCHTVGYDYSLWTYMRLLIMTPLRLLKNINWQQSIKVKKMFWKNPMLEGSESFLFFFPCVGVNWTSLFFVFVFLLSKCISRENNQQINGSGK